MSKINELITKLCPNGVEYRKLEKCCNILDNKRKPVKKGERQEGKYPYYGANGIQDYVADYIFDGEFVLVGEDGSVINTSGNPVVNWAEGKIWVNNHAHVIEEIEGIKLRYLFHYIQTLDVTDLIHGNIPKLNQGDFRGLLIAVPPIEVQEEIIRILDKFSKLEAELEAELEARKKQYEYWCAKLFEVDNVQKWGNMETICDVITDYVANGSFGDIAKNVTYKNEPDYAVLLRTADYSNGYNPEKFIYIDEHAYNYLKKSKLFGDEIIINNVGAGVGTTFLCPKLKTNMSLAPNTIMLRTKNNRYYYYWLKSKYGQDAIRSITSKSAMPKFNKTGFRKIMAPAPSEEEMNKVVNILDKFEKLINDLKEGLPAEIQLRRKQYEYYRNKLLNFEELK